MDDKTIRKLEDSGFYGVEKAETKALKDKYGKCPNCNIGLDGGDVYQELSKLDLFTNMSQKEMEKFAGDFGWERGNSKRFTRLIACTIDGHILYRCPNPSCGYYFDGDTGFPYENLEDFRDRIPTVYTAEEFSRYLKGIKEDVIDMEDDEGKAVSDMTMDEVKSMIELKMKKYEASEDKKVRKELKRDYLELVDYYNKETNTKTFKKDL